MQTLGQMGGMAGEKLHVYFVYSCRGGGGEGEGEGEGGGEGGGGGEGEGGGGEGGVRGAGSRCCHSLLNVLFTDCTINRLHY
jgi:hypothetical protein